MRIPAAATILEVDGERLPLPDLSLQPVSPSPCVFLPKGTHVVRFRPNEPLTIEIAGDLSESYRAMQDFFGFGDRLDDQALMTRSAWAMDVHNTPFLLSFMGASQAGKEQWEAAERKFRRALHVNPAFSPAHLNLAFCLSRRNAKQEAAREVELADAFNVGNVFGLAAAITELRRELALGIGVRQAVEFPAAGYLDSGTLSEEDRRLTAFLLAASKYAVRPEERGKILNNLACHFAERNQIDLALEHFRGALAVFKVSGAERYKLAQRVLTNMSDACRKANFVEADEYRAMQGMVQP